MKVDYNKLVELNKEASIENGVNTLSCYFLIQRGVEEFLMNGTLSDQNRTFLIDLGVLIESEEESQRRNIVGPFNFSTNGSTNS
jgi:hypothetical protein